MTKRKTDGFILMILIVAIFLMAAETYFLTAGANTIASQANDAYLGAVEQNLIASSLAWAKQNVKNTNAVTFNKVIELDLSEINIQRAVLSLIITGSEDRQTTVQIDVRCGYARQNFRHHGKYKIEF